jgi:hypothetical protein
MNKATVTRLLESVNIPEEEKRDLRRMIKGADESELQGIFMQLRRKARGTPQTKVQAIRGAK